MDKATADVRLAFEPLEAAATGGRPRHPARASCRWCDDSSTTRGWCIKESELAVTLGVSSRTVHRWRSSGLAPDQADELAVFIGSHPAIVWGVDWDCLAEAPLDQDEQDSPTQPLAS